MSSQLKKLKKTAKLLLALLATNNALAAQTIVGADKAHVEVSISMKERNRLSMSGARIATAVPSREGVLTYSKDDDSGSLYFGLNEVGRASGGTITLFISDDRGDRYTLLLVPKAIAGEDIVLVATQKDGVSKSKSPSVEAVDGRSGSHVRRVKELTVAMADDEGRLGVGELMNREVALWQEARLVYESKYVDGGLVGEKYRLTNVSKGMMVLSEQEFFRRGVLGVAIDAQTLAPNEETKVYIVRKGKENE